MEPERRGCYRGEKSQNSLSGKGATRIIQPSCTDPQIPPGIPVGLCHSLGSPGSAWTPWGSRTVPKSILSPPPWPWCSCSWAQLLPSFSISILRVPRAPGLAKPCEAGGAVWGCLCCFPSCGHGSAPQPWAGTAGPVLSHTPCQDRRGGQGRSVLPLEFLVLLNCLWLKNSAIFKGKNV